MKVEEEFKWEIMVDLDDLSNLKHPTKYKGLTGKDLQILQSILEKYGLLFDVVTVNDEAPDERRFRRITAQGIAYKREDIPDEISTKEEIYDLLNSAIDALDYPFKERFNPRREAMQFS